LPMVGRARWILIGAAMMLVAVAFSWSCGGGGNSNCIVNQGGIAVNECAGFATPGPFLQKISLCQGTPPPPTPVPSSTASTVPTPIETTCPAPLPTTVVPLGGMAIFHAVGVFSDLSTQDITNNASTNWTSSNPSIVMPNTGTPGSAAGPGTYFAVGLGSASINANSGGIYGPGASVVVTASATPIATASPTPTSPATSPTPTATPMLPTATMTATPTP